MEAITFEQMNQLNNEDLVVRMDLALRTARSERLGQHYNPQIDMDPYVSQFIDTKVFKSLPTDQHRRAIWKTFDLIIQMEYVRSYGGVQNSLPLPQREGETWVSPRFLIPFLAQEQASIVGARIVLERFMDLIVFLVTGRELAGGSKFGAFKDWLFAMPIESEWFYLIPQLPWLRKHDLDFRTAEVHDGSKLKKYLVTLQDIPSDLQNEVLDLTNLLSNLWRNVLPILNGHKATSIGGLRPDHNAEWLSNYINGDIAELQKLKDDVQRRLRG